jgi:hypothetical protein
MRTAYRNLIDTATTVTASTQLTNNPVSNVRDGRLTTKWISDTTTTQSVVVELPTFPEYPDNVAGTKYLNRTWATIDSWSANASPPLTVSNGKLIMGVGQQYAFRSLISLGGGVAAGDTVRCKATALVSGYAFTSITAPTFAQIAASPILQAGQSAILDWVIPAGASGVYFGNTSLAASFAIEFIYIGDGTYSSLALDASGNGNHGTVFGCTPVAGITGRALQFDGVNDQVELPATLAPAFGVGRVTTVAGWFKPNTTTPGTYLFAFPDTATGNRFYIIVSSATQCAFVYNDSVNRAFNLASNELAHIVCIRDNSATGVFQIYKNGALIGSFTGSTIPTALTPAVKSYFGSGGGGGYSGSTIDDPRIYNRALSQAEITSLYNREGFASEMLGLVGWWKLDKDYHVNTAAILGHNIKSGTTVKIQANNSDAWDDPELSETFTYVASDATILRFLDEVKVYKYWRFSFTGQASVQAGRLWLGEYMTINPASLLDFTVTKKRSDVVIYGRDRQKFANPGVGWRRFSLKFPASDKAMIYKVEQMYDAVGQHTSFIFCNFDTSREWPLVEPVYCSFDNDLDFTHTQRQKYSYTLNIEEDK